MKPVILDETPGLPEVVEIIQTLGGVLLPPDAAAQMGVAAWYTAERALKAEALADASDGLHYLMDNAPGFFTDETIDGVRVAAHFLDVMSYEMRNP